MGEDIYVRLREFMDTMPAGYPTTPSGIEIKILKKLFSPDDAEMVMKLKTEPEEISAIAARLGMCHSRRVWAIGTGSTHSCYTCISNI